MKRCQAIIARLDVTSADPDEAHRALAVTIQLLCEHSDIKDAVKVRVPVKFATHAQSMRF